LKITDILGVACGWYQFREKCLHGHFLVIWLDEVPLPVGVPGDSVSISIRRNCYGKQTVPHDVHKMLVGPTLQIRNIISLYEDRSRYVADLREFHRRRWGLQDVIVVAI